MRTAEQNRAHVSKWQRANRDKANANHRRWRANNLDHARKYERDRRKTAREADPIKVHVKNRTRSLAQYGLTIETWDALFAAQGYCCAVCKGTESGDGRWHTDHDAAIGKHAVRGILCVRCNIGIGQFQDDPVRLQRAIVYLQRTS